ncbi:MAG: M20 family metallopeptidase [Anaerolineae bacterium]|nr:M20 family metallopeptidase [Anaerolineae bacterium]
MTDPFVAYLTHHFNRYVADLRELVAIDTGGRSKSGIEAINAWLEARLKTLGFAVTYDRQPVVGDNLLGIRQGRGQKKILLLGHSDIIYPTGIVSHRPITIEGDMLLGPGTCDMKAGLLTGLYAVEALLAEGFEDFGALYYLVVSDEETHPRYSIPFLQKISRQVDVAFSLEAARENGDIVVARKGLRWYTITAIGRAAHAGVEPEKGRNAVVALARKVDALAQLNDFRPGVTVNVGSFHGGTEPNVVADQATIRIDLRAFRQVDLEATEQAVHDLFSQPLDGVHFDVRHEPTANSPIMERTPAIAELEQLVQQLAASLGFRVKGAMTGGASDASYVAAEGVPILDGLGPIGGLDHSPAEYIELSSVVPRTALLAKAMAAVGGGSG